MGNHADETEIDRPHRRRSAGAGGRHTCLLSDAQHSLQRLDALVGAPPAPFRHGIISPDGLRVGIRLARVRPCWVDKLDLALRDLS